MFRRGARPEETSSGWHAAIAGSDSYVTRVMCGMVLSLAVALVAVHLPLEERFDRVGWHVASEKEKLTVDHLDRDRQSPASEARATRFDEALLASDPISEAGEQSLDRPSSSADTDQTDASERLAGRKVLDFAQRMPQIVGGLGAYYIHIDYPETAVRQGIEGRLVLSFVVDTEGRTNTIEVVEPLHPACDSAAVRALRRTRFVPGSQEGQPVQVKMQLPVRFQLVPHAAQTSADMKG